VAKKFKFTREDLDKTILAALDSEPAAGGQPQGGGKPNALQMLLAKKGLKREENERS